MLHGFATLASRPQAAVCASLQPRGSTGAWQCWVRVYGQPKFLHCMDLQHSLGHALAMQLAAEVAAPVPPMLGWWCVRCRCARSEQYGAEANELD